MAISEELIDTEQLTTQPIAFEVTRHTEHGVDASIDFHGATAFQIVNILPQTPLGYVTHVCSTRKNETAKKLYTVAYIMQMCLSTMDFQMESFFQELVYRLNE